MKSLKVKLSDYSNSIAAIGELSQESPRNQHIWKKLAGLVARRVAFQLADRVFFSLLRNTDARF